MESHYDLVLFSASEDAYSKAFFEYFNGKTDNGIKEYLSRDYCIQAYKNIFFKDLRIIQSRSLKDMVLLDNSAFSFGSLIDNGVPIMTYDCS
jgi:CTD small phosphatase-like protein 2